MYLYRAKIINIIDVNECAERRGICSYQCRNTLGGFECTCAPGQIQLADKQSCAGTH